MGRKSGINFQDRVELLTQLGLTINQARVYLALVSNNSCTAKQISRLSNLRDEVVYRAMPSLQAFGLVKRILAHPAKFEATPIEQATDILFDRKKKQISDIGARIIQLQSLKTEPEIKNTQKSEVTSVLVGKERILQLLEGKMKETQRSLSVVAPQHDFYEWMCAHRNLLKKLAKKKAAIRFIIAGCNTEKYAEETLDFLEGDNCGIVSSQTQLRACLIIFDDSEVMVSTSIEAPFGQAPIYLSNIPDLVAFCKFYFEKSYKTIKNHDGENRDVL